MRIADVRTHVLLDPGFDRDATSSAQDTIVVEIETDDGLVGIGETDLNAWVARACIEAPGTHTMDRGLRASLLGRDPSDPRALWEELYLATAMTGRRGAGVHALGALDMALWDLRGKAEGVPCWRLWGEPARDVLTPYASLQPDASSHEAYVESMRAWALRAQAAGFGAVKVEATFAGPYVHKGLVGGDERVVEVVAAVRRAVGPELAILVDVQYAFMHDVDRALRLAGQLAELGVFFLETPLWADDLDGYARLCAASPVRIAAGEWLATRHEFAELARSGLHVLQPDIGRVGGFTEALLVCELAAAHDRLVVPHAWKTGISAAAAAQLAMVTPHMPFFEFLPPELCESRLRRELVRDGLRLVDGALPPPAAPGLGVELDRDAMAEFAAAAVRAYP